MFLRRAVAYSAGNFGSQIMLFIQGIVVRSLLRPEIMGFWNLANVIKDLVMPITIGLLNGAGRELPVLRGRGDETGQRDVRSVTLLYSLAEVILVAIGVIVY
ncbi:MAG: hypothetical protein KKB20_04205, partial [Proteobacteria bacterium]|nr:hypothetical protein [Pseudomonadota bacterium]